MFLVWCIQCSQQGRRKVWKMGVSVLFGGPHCSYLNIYISWKISLCLINLEDQVQVNFLTKPIIFFIWKFKSIILIFALFFAHCWCYFQKVESFESNCNSSISTLGNSINSVQKALDLTTPAKNRRNMRIIYLDFRINKLIGFACRVVWNWPFKSTTQSLIFCEM